jgi:Zn-dependent protease with chaperone function
MHWLYLLLGMAFLLAASRAAGWLVVLLLLAALVAFVAWILGWVTSRISSGARNDAQIISPDELRRMREQAEARKHAGQASPTDPQT